MSSSTLPSSSAPPTSSALRFLTERLRDRDFGGFYRASDLSGRRPLSTEKHLPDQSSAVLALAKRGDDDELRAAADGLLCLQDRQGRPGFVELTDRSWRPDPAGDVRSLRFQLHAGAALLAAAFRLGADDLRVQAVDLLDRCLCTAEEARFPNRLSADWRTVLDATDNPQTAVSAVRALAVAHSVGEPGVDFTPLPAIARRLGTLVESARSSAVPAELRRCGSLARIAVALTQASVLLDGDEHLKTARTALDLAMSYFHDQVHGGFWDRVAPDGTTRVDWVWAPQQGLPPYPIKRTSDTAQLVRAGQLLTSCGVDATDVITAGTAAITAFTDARHGGVFLGTGYQWLGELEPAVPAQRQPWPAPRHPGVAVESGPRYLALQQKSAHAHASVAQLDPVDAGGRPAPDSDVVPLASAARRGAVERLNLETMSRRRLGGALPELVAPPGGAVSWQVSTAYHAITNLRLLAGSPPVPRELADAVLAAQNDDGGFGEQPGDLSDVTGTYRALVVAGLAHQEPASAAVDYVRACRGSDGGYGAVPGLASDVWHTGLALAALHLLDADAEQTDETARFLLSCHSGTAGFGQQPGLAPTVPASRRAVGALSLLGVAAPAGSAEIAWLREHQSASGGFSSRIGGPVSLPATYHGVAALAVLGARPTAADACVNWLLACRDNGVSSGPVALTGEDDFACLQALALLDGTRDGGWATLVG
ncbi:MAG TPA: prenyltransferase/squalene oxidase repeat-containing protein [Pseudonocardiaceae bacterium]|jgi:prenyltransferase beta subunit|nr:prenyltransferase/squalene oxidase repeat-containing protein [Pseudonocardiaceae bacterium]